MQFQFKEITELNSKLFLFARQLFSEIVAQFLDVSL